jgi:hypothetical protein
MPAVQPVAPLTFVNPPPDLEISSLTRGDIAELRMHLAVNLILVSTRPPGTLITIQGLQGFDTQSGPIEIHGPDAQAVSKNAAGYWDRERGWLRLFGATLLGNCLDCKPKGA